jgi:hypothetical protein
VAILSAYALICEKALVEQDGVVSAVRIIDVFTVPNPDDLPRDIPPPIVIINVLASIRVTPDDDGSHAVELKMIRPEGEEARIGVVEGIPFPKSRYPEFPKNVMFIAQIGVIVKKLGFHDMIVFCDGNEVARTGFILALALALPETKLTNGSAAQS